MRSLGWFLIGVAVTVNAMVTPSGHLTPVGYGVMILGPVLVWWSYWQEHRAGRRRDS